MRLLVLDAALARCSAAVVFDGRIVALRQAMVGRGQAAALPPLAAGVLADGGLDADLLDGVAVTVGPGSFTGLRSAIALAQGIALAAGKPVVGVTVAEALAAALPPSRRALWVAIYNRRGRVFLDCGGSIAAVGVDALPPAPGPVAVAGDAAIEVAARLAARGDDVMLTDARQPDPAAIAAVGAGRLRGELPPLVAQPLYVDPVEARLPAGGLRPPPVEAIRPATSAHAAAMAAIHAASFPVGQQWGADAMLLQLQLPGTFGLIDPAGGMLLARVAADEAEILTIAVAPAARRQGRAATLLRAALDRAEGARSVFLEVAEGNAPARALYAAAGFTEVGRRRRYYADGADALVLRRVAGYAGK